MIIVQIVFNGFLLYARRTYSSVITTGSNNNLLVTVNHLFNKAANNKGYGAKKLVRPSRTTCTTLTLLWMQTQ